jgi:redox-sensitive bicupin YhaK (pirin superfamily)
MSGPVSDVDAPARPESDRVGVHTVEITESREAQVGAVRVRRALPKRARRTVGAWCFVDHMGPVEVTREHGVDVAPHPHIGLQTVTWLIAGEVLHRDSLGTEQVISPGQLNLMTAGRGVSHSEEATGGYAGEMQGLQLWVAQPAATRDGESAFEHHAELPRIELGDGDGTVLVGELGGVASPARRDTDHVGVDLDLRGRAVVPIRAEHEHALVVVDGAVDVDGHTVTPGQLAYLGLGRDECAFTARESSRALLIGGVPFPEPVLMWWNFVARTREEISAAYTSWALGDDRYGRVASPLPRTEVAPPPWMDRGPGA